jgi:hypothetical protein
VSCELHQAVRPLLTLVVIGRVDLVVGGMVKRYVFERVLVVPVTDQ